VNQTSSSFKTIHTFVVPENHTPTRLDNFVHRHFSLYSRTFIQNLIQQGFITLNKKKTKSSILVKAHDVITITIPEEEPAFITQPTPEQKNALEQLNIKILYRDEHFAVLDKPPFLMVHRPSTKNKEITLVDWLVNSMKEIAIIGHPSRPGIVHRLDKDTSGLLIVARSPIGQNILSNLFKHRGIKKTYLAIVQGHPDKEGTIDAPIGRNPIVRNQMTINGIEARPAITHYKVLRYFENSALLEVSPVTGRTHQIRVHLKALGHPIIGDEVYGSKSPLIKRHALHAHTLTFNFNGKNFFFESPLPPDMVALIEKLSSEKK
jgi:23S rRNA pseudouridine1911/1915/1917 synthase